MSIPKHGYYALSSVDKRSSSLLGDLEIDELGGLSCASWTKAVAMAHCEHEGGHTSDSDAEVEVEVETSDGHPCSSSSQRRPSGGPLACNLQEKAQMARDRMMAIAENAAKRRAVRERDQKVNSARKMAQLKLLAYAKSTGYPYKPFAQKSDAGADSVAPLVKSDNSVKLTPSLFPPDGTKARPKPSQAKTYRNKSALLVKKSRAERISVTRFQER